MTINEYQQLALTTENGMNREYPRVLNAALGLTAESGEFADIFKKIFFHGHEMDEETRVHAAKELGDVAWYIAVGADALGYTLEEVLSMNVEKLQKRYPNGFESVRSQHRAEGDV